MKVLMINVVCGIRSTGRICTDLATALEAQGHEVRIAYGRENVPEQFQKYAVRIGTDLDVKLHGVKARLIDGCGFGSKRATEKFIGWVKDYDPDVVHLHNIHGYYINVEVLFRYLKTYRKRIIWTLHDCWAFTGHCVYFEYANCNHWMNGCHNCPQKKEYPKTIIDRSKANWGLKKKVFEGIDNLKIVTPSQWLANLVHKSFLSEYDTRVINNGVDISLFHKTEVSKVRELIPRKKIILGVASVWDRRKGLTYMNKLAMMLGNDYQVVIIGASENQKKELSEKIMVIPRTNNVQELAEWYSAATIFVNPTLEDNYPTTNLEAISCGTPVVTFDTGGSPESARIFGKVVEKGNIETLLNAIKNESFVHTDTIPIKERMVEEYLKIYIS